MLHPFSSLAENSDAQTRRDDAIVSSRAWVASDVLPDAHSMTANGREMMRLDILLAIFRSIPPAHAATLRTGRLRV